MIRACIGIANSKLSFHLNVLKKADLIDGKSKGNWIICSLIQKGRDFIPSHDPVIDDGYRTW
jgi:ArsR family transcriptional regulator